MTGVTVSSLDCLDQPTASLFHETTPPPPLPVGSLVGPLRVAARIRHLRSRLVHFAWGVLHTWYTQIPHAFVHFFTFLYARDFCHVSTPNGLDPRGPEHTAALSALPGVRPYAHIFVAISRSALKRDKSLNRVAAGASEPAS